MFNDEIMKQCLSRYQGRGEDSDLDEGEVELWKPDTNVQ